MSQNSGGYNGYFYENNLSALQRAKMPTYNHDKNSEEADRVDGQTVEASLAATEETTGERARLTNLLNEVQLQKGL